MKVYSGGVPSDHSYNINMSSNDASQICKSPSHPPGNLVINVLDSKVEPLSTRTVLRVAFPGDCS